MYELNMPKFGATMTEGELAEWKVKVGDRVTKGDVVCVVSSEKITNDVETYASGIVKEILLEEGETAEIGTVIMRVEED
jgi:pyruvate/2-oxoglutarate dehydrogenase complex dihydrolipoamide acyltransferase (E2) component